MDKPGEVGPGGRMVGRVATLLAGVLIGTAPGAGPAPEPGRTSLEPIRISADGRDLVRAGSGERFVVWGVNYDHDAAGRLLEDYWAEEWAAVASDFAEMKALGANTVRIHLQLGRFLPAPGRPDRANLERLDRLVRLAEGTGLYLDITGLGCYHRRDVPPWYDALDEAGRWEAQALFWSEVAKVCAGRPAVFCYDLMNEPILPGPGQVETNWLAGEFAGSHFVQRISRDLAGRTREEVAKQWVARLVGAIRGHDARTLVTVGVIPWSQVWPGAQPIFYAPGPRTHLDFVSVHLYPRAGKLEQDLEALSVYELGKPLLIEEFFPLSCPVSDLARFVEATRPRVDGWIGFYWGKTIEEYDAGGCTIADALTRGWLEYFRDARR